MASSSAKTVSAYLKELPADKRRDIQAVRKVILANLPDGYEERMDFGMICYCVPLSHYPDTYNGRPLCYASLAAQKNSNAVYLNGVYGDGARASKFRAAFTRAGKKLDMGKSCVRFKAATDLALDAVGDAISETSVDQYIVMYEQSRKKD